MITTERNDENVEVREVREALISSSRFEREKFARRLVATDLDQMLRSHITKNWLVRAQFVADETLQVLSSERDILARHIGDDIALAMQLSEVERQQLIVAVRVERGRREKLGHIRLLRQPCTRKCMCKNEMSDRLGF